MASIENKILEEIDNKWIEYSKNIPKVEDEIVNQYVNILEFYDSLYPDIKESDVSSYNIAKTIILTHLRGNIIDEIEGTEYESKVADKYNKKKLL